MAGAVPVGHESFESIRRTTAQGQECWSSRQLAGVLGYTGLRNLEQVLAKAKQACVNSGQAVEQHFEDIDEVVEVGKGAQRPVRTTLLSRYACYLLIQNADPQKPMVALGQTYFAVQTRKQELSELGQGEDDMRLHLRSELKTHNTRLAEAAHAAGVQTPKDYAIFQNHGYQGLCGGQGQAQIHRTKGLKKNQRILDHMGSTELAANLFRATQAEDKLRRDGIRSQAAANQLHKAVGAKVRQTIRELGGTMPEDLPAAESIKKLEARKKVTGRRAPSKLKSR
jgi:DNA-damage-inducible protein D